MNRHCVKISAEISYSTHHTKMSNRPRFQPQQQFNKKQRTSPTTWKGRSTENVPTEVDSSSQPYCPLCGDGESVKLLTSKKEGPNQGRQFYSCSVHNSFKWADEVEDGQQPVLEANKSKFLDKSKQQGSGQVQRVRDQYQGGNKEFRNPAPFQSPKPSFPSSSSSNEDITDVIKAVNHLEGRIKEMSKMLCELYEACQQQGQPPEDPEEDPEVEKKEEKKDDSNKENVKPAKH